MTSTAPPETDAAAASESPRTYSGSSGKRMDSLPLPGTVPEEAKAMVDRFGFALSREESGSALRKVHSEGYKSALRKQNARLKKWKRMLDNWERHYKSESGELSAKLKSRIRKGIPSAVRWLVWAKLTGAEGKLSEAPRFYQRLLTEAPLAKWSRVIDRDIDRTFPTHSLFSSTFAMSSAAPCGLVPLDEDRRHSHGIGQQVSEGEMEEKAAAETRAEGGRRSLQNVLYALATHDPVCGYCQGMGFVAAMLLTMVTEEYAFWMLQSLLSENGVYQLRGIYLDGLPLLHLRFFQFEQVLAQHCPAVAEHLHALGIVPALYASKWFIAVFCRDTPFETVLRIWDCFLAEGIKIVFRVALAFIKLREKELLKMDFEKSLLLMQSLDKRVDSDELMSTAFSLKLTTAQLNAAAEKYKEQKEAEESAKRRAAKAATAVKSGAATGGKAAPTDIDPDTGVRKSGLSPLQIDEYILEVEELGPGTPVLDRMASFSTSLSVSADAI